MPYAHHWYVPKRVILAKVWGNQDIDEITRSSNEMLTKLDEGIPLVHILMDDSKLGSVPINLGQLGKAISFARHKSLGWVILIGEGNRVTKFLLEMLGKISRINVRREPTMEKALTFLQGRDITIPWNEADKNIVSSF
jgi:hypothetical protein